MSTAEISSHHYGNEERITQANNAEEVSRITEKQGCPRERLGAGSSDTSNGPPQIRALENFEERGAVAITTKDGLLGRYLLDDNFVLVMLTMSA